MTEPVRLIHGHIALQQTTFKAEEPPKGATPTLSTVQGFPWR